MARWLALLVCLSCGAPPMSHFDAGGLPPADAGRPPADAGTGGADSGIADAGIVEPADAGIVDAGPDLSADDGGCAYQATDNFVMQCAGWRVLHHVEAPSCAPQISSGAHVYADVAAAAAALGCDTACVYVERIAALFVYCDARGEYTQLVPGGQGQTGPDSACATLYYFETVAGTGFYPSREAFEAAHPCH